MFSNLEVENIFSLSVFNKRIEEIISKQFDENQRLNDERKMLQSSNQDMVLKFENVNIAWSPYIKVFDDEKSGQTNNQVVLGFNAEF